MSALDSRNVDRSDELDLSAAGYLRVGAGNGLASGLVSRRAVVVGLAVAALAVTGMFLNLATGEFDMGLSEAISALRGAGSEGAVYTVRELRLPRTLVALAVGGGLGVSGAVFQRLAGNPLASPEILGVESGAATAAVIAIVVFGETIASIPVFALAGSFGVTAFIYLMTFRSGMSGSRLILMGIGVTALLGSVTSYLLVAARLEVAEMAMVWLTGSLGARDWVHVGYATAGIVVFVPAVAYLGSRLQLLTLGTDMAQALGVRAERTRLGLVFCGAGLAALATAAAGPVPFIALASPQIARRLAGNRSTSVFPSMLVGAALLVGSDLLARRIFAPNEFPVGVVTAVLGAPVLLWVLARHHRERG